MTTSLTSDAVAQAMTDAAKMATALDQANAAAAAGTDSPLMQSFEWWTSYVQLLVAMKLMTPEEGTAFLQGLYSAFFGGGGPAPLVLPEIPSPETFILYDLLRSFVAQKAGLTNDAGDVLHDIFTFLTHVGGIVDAATTVVEALSDLWHSIVG